MAATIRAAHRDDVDVIARFNVAMALESENVTLDLATVQAGVRAVIERPELGRYFVASVPEQVQACLLITYEWSDWRNGLFWWIQSVYVTPAQRQRGVFASLYGHVKAAARDAGSAGLRLYVERDNQRAQRTYARLGMCETHYRLYEELF